MFGASKKKDEIVDLQKIAHSVGKLLEKQISLIYNDHKNVADTVYNILLNQIALIIKNKLALPVTDVTAVAATNKPADDRNSDNRNRYSDSFSSWENNAYNAMKNMLSSGASFLNNGQGGPTPTTPSTPEFTENYKKFLDENNEVQIEMATKETNKDGTIVVKTLGLAGLKDLGESFYTMNDTGQSDETSSQFQTPMQVPLMQSR